MGLCPDGSGHTQCWTERLFPAPSLVGFQHSGGRSTPDKQTVLQATGNLRSSGQPLVKLLSCGLLETQHRLPKLGQECFLSPGILAGGYRSTSACAGALSPDIWCLRVQGQLCSAWGPGTYDVEMRAEKGRSFPFLPRPCSAAAALRLSLVPSFLRQRQVQTSQTPQVPWEGPRGVGEGGRWEARRG